MRNRALDIALIVGLVLVAGAIVWTLFSLGRDPAPPRPEPAGPPVEDGAPDPDDPGIVPVEPGPVSPDEEAADGSPAPADDEAAGADGPATDDAPPADAQAGAAGEDEGPAPADVSEAGGAGDDAGAGVGSTAADRPDPDVPAAEAPPLPADGPVPLGRIGFSYVTGGAGACGIELEAWTHVAVSRELLEEYGCGAEVTITLDDETAGRSEVDVIVADTMNEAFSRTANIYVGEDEPALEFGLTSGTLVP